MPHLPLYAMADNVQHQRNCNQGHSHDGEEIDLLIEQGHEGVVDKHPPEEIAGGSALAQNQGGHGQREEGEGGNSIDDGIQIEMFGRANRTNQWPEP